MLTAALDATAYAAQVPGHGEGAQGGTDGHLAVQGQVFGQRLDVHGGAVGQVVDIPGDIPLTLRQEGEVVAAGLALAGDGLLAVAGVGLTVRA